jgi:hypothetical protein
MKTGHEFDVIGLHPSGKERIDIKITSRFDLMREAELRRQSRQYMKDMVWTPHGFQPINPEYLARGIAAREEQQEFKKIDDQVRQYEYKCEDKTIVKYYEVPVKDPLTAALEFARKNAEENGMDFGHENPSLIDKIAGWFKK